jgi:hypothetical protein
MIAPVWENDEGSQHLYQSWAGSGDRTGAPVGMRLAENVADLDLAVAPFTANRREASRVSQAQLHTRLGKADGAILTDWLERAEGRGIDDAIDLSVRPWNIDGACVIVGIFERNQPEASWLIVQCSAGWMLADCADGSVSEVSVALSDILALIGDDPRG